jgi:6-phosphofructokinase
LFVEVMGRDAGHMLECRYWCRSRGNLIPEEDLGLDRY